MKKKWGLIIVVIAAATVLGAGIIIFYLIRHPLLIYRITDPISAYTKVTWDRGPEKSEVPAEKRPPNVILILADDLGYNDITLNGGGVAGGAVPTPNIDSIAKNGVTFTNGYSGCATCAPSRASLMTGRYPTRFGFEFTPVPKVFSQLIANFDRGRGRSPHPVLYFKDREKDSIPMEKMGIPPGEITIAELLAPRGYHTMLLGKWHLGGAPGLRPIDQGFKEFLGFYEGGQMFLPENDPGVVNSKQDFDPIDVFLWNNLPFSVRKDAGGRFTPNAYMTDYLTNEAISAIDSNRNRPFFMYLAYNAPHTPLQATKADYDALSNIKDHRLRVYAAMIRSLDRNIGRVLDALREKGLENNTIVVFTSDNGGAHYIGLPDINRPYRGWKATFFEGGTHVPFFIKWPAGLPRGSKVAAPVSHFDIFSTIAAAAGAAVPSDRVIDGVNLITFARGTAPGVPHDTLFWRSGHYRTVIAGGWKLQVSERPQKVWLFNLNSDPTEKVNLAESNLGRVNELKKLIEEHDKSSVKPIWPALIEGPIPIDHTLPDYRDPNEEFVYWAN